MRSKFHVAAHGIALQYSRFEHPTYRQLPIGRFVLGLPILDALFCLPPVPLAEWVEKT